MEQGESGSCVQRQLLSTLVRGWELPYLPMNVAVLIVTSVCCNYLLFCLCTTQENADLVHDNVLGTSAQDE